MQKKTQGTLRNRMLSKILLGPVPGAILLVSGSRRGAKTTRLVLARRHLGKFRGQLPEIRRHRSASAADLDSRKSGNKKETFRNRVKT